MTTKRKFSGFDLGGAMELLGFKDLERWQISCPQILPSPFFEKRMRRLVGALNYVLGKCEENLAQRTQAA